jgi:hypothetical protein
MGREVFIHCRKPRGGLPLACFDVREGRLKYLPPGFLFLFAGRIRATQP